MLDFLIVRQIVRQIIRHSHVSGICVRPIRRVQQLPNQPRVLFSQMGEYIQEREHMMRSTRREYRVTLPLPPSVMKNKNNKRVPYKYGGDE